MRSVWKEVTFRMTQVFTGHGKFERFRHRIKQERTPGCRYCVDRPEDTVEHTEEVWPLGRNTAVSLWRLSAAVTSRAGPWFRKWSGARRGGGRSPPSAKQ
ncbi:hypothetical protein PYW07_005301 [Mythimna separata]|uniref:Uncharacterized protein n=1 Tax=Mythimna separata TaxID=271217 RepID=A0AAD7YE40_MYTSE|nr:hypothetical protein PYW07_005301 [Mythimna separata]